MPRDGRALSVFADEVGVDAIIPKAADRGNKLHLAFQVQKFMEENPMPHDEEVVIDTVTYKKGTDILEESQQLAYAVRLAGIGYKVKVQESKIVIEDLKKYYGDLFSYEVKA